MEVPQRLLPSLPVGRPDIVQPYFGDYNVEKLRKDVARTKKYMSQEEDHWWDTQLDVMTKGDKYF